MVNGVSYSLFTVVGVCILACVILLTSFSFLQSAPVASVVVPDVLLKLNDKADRIEDLLLSMVMDEKPSQIKSEETTTKTTTTTIPSGPVSWINCSDMHLRAQALDRACVYHNFCVSRTGGIFPRYPLHLTDFQKHNAWSILPQLSAYVDEGGAIFETFRPMDNLDNLDVEDRSSNSVLLMWTPAAWPNKFPAHSVLNNFIPVLRHLLRSEPRFFFTERNTSGFVWPIHVDMYVRCCGFAGERIDPQKRHIWKWIARDIWDDLRRRDEPMSLLDELPAKKAFCYETVHVGVGGRRANWRRLSDDPTLWSVFRKSFLSFASSIVPSCWPIEPQAQRKTPRVVLVQRDDVQGNVATLGNRLFANIDVLDALLHRLAKEEHLLDYDGYVMFLADQKSAATVANRTKAWSIKPKFVVGEEQQACYVSSVGVLIGIHGNALALATFMERKTVMIEVYPVHKYYEEMCASVGLQYLKYSPKEHNSPAPEEFERMVRSGVELWRKQFKQ